MWRVTPILTFVVHAVTEVHNLIDMLMAVCMGITKCNCVRPADRRETSFSLHKPIGALPRRWWMFWLLGLLCCDHVTTLCVFRTPKMIILFMDVYKSGSTDGLGFVFWRVCLVSFWREQTIWTIFGDKNSFR